MNRPKNMDEFSDGTVMAHPRDGVYRRDADGWKVLLGGKWVVSIEPARYFAVPPLGLVTPPPEPKPLTVGELEDWVVFEHDGRLWQASAGRTENNRWCFSLNAPKDSDWLLLSIIPTKVYGILGRDCEITMIEKGGA